MTVTLDAFVIDGSVRLVATLHIPRDFNGMGVLIVPGGQQIRAGSHRQFWRLGQTLAAAGFACLRIDLPGLGDSEGELRDFQANGEALRAAVDAFFARLPAMQSLALWGLCDGASAAALHARDDSRVAALVLVNPWVRTEQGQAQALVSHYYGSRLVSAAFWRKLLSGRMAIGKSLREYVANRKKARHATQSPSTSLPARIFSALAGNAIPALVITGSEDLTGQEFLEAAARYPEARFDARVIDGADHTFSREDWHDALEQASRDFLMRLKPAT